MDIVTKIYVFLILCGIGHTKDLKPQLYIQGGTATVQVDQLQMNGNKMLEINFSGYTSKIHVTNVMLYDPMKNQDYYMSINRNYTGRIKNARVSNISLSFLLLNVTLMDSGNYTIFEDSIEKGKTSLLVARYRSTGKVKEPMVLPFMYNNMNISTIQIEMLLPSITYPVVIYDVNKENCTDFGQLYMARIRSCVLSGNSFSFTFREVSWLDKGTYAAWDDKELLLDTILVDVVDLSESFTSNVEDELLSTQTVESAGSSTSYTRPPPSSDECGLKADIEMNGVFAQMFKVEAERLSIERERLRAELERLKVEKERLAFEYERLVIEKERIEILKSKPTDRQIHL